VASMPRESPPQPPPPPLSASSCTKHELRYLCQSEVFPLEALNSPSCLFFLPPARKSLFSPTFFSKFFLSFVTRNSSLSFADLETPSLVISYPLYLFFILSLFCFFFFLFSYQRNVLSFLPWKEDLPFKAPFALPPGQCSFG